MAQGGTRVVDGAALELESDLLNEGVELNGVGSSTLNAHPTGALRNISNDNTFTGTLFLNTATTTIGVDTEADLQAVAALMAERARATR